MMKKKWLLAGMLLLAFTLCACGKQDDAEETMNKEQQVNTDQTEQSTEEDPEPSMEEEEPKTEPEEETASEIFFNGEYKEEDGSYWSFYEDGKLHVTDADGTEADFTYIYKGNILTVTASDGTSADFELFAAEEGTEGVYTINRSDGVSTTLTFVTKDPTETPGGTSNAEGTDSSGASEDLGSLEDTENFDADTQTGENAE